MASLDPTAPAVSTPPGVIALRVTAALNCCVALCGIGLAVTGAFLLREPLPEQDFVWATIGIVGVGVWSVVVLTINVLGVVCPRKPWMHVLGIVLLGLTVVCGGCWVAAIIGLVFWVRPDTRQWLQAGSRDSLA